MPISITSGPILPRDQSFTLNGSAQNPLATAYPATVPAGQYPTGNTNTPAGTNPYRTHLQFQAPASCNIVYSYTNSSPPDPASFTGGNGCYLLLAGQTWVQASSIPCGPLYVNGGAAGNGKTMTLTEC